MIDARHIDRAAHTLGGMSEESGPSGSSRLRKVRHRLLGLMMRTKRSVWLALIDKKSLLTFPEDSGLESFYDADSVPMFHTTATISHEPASSETSRSSSVGSTPVYSLQSSVSQLSLTPTSCTSIHSHHLVNNHQLLLLQCS